MSIRTLAVCLAASWLFTPGALAQQATSYGVMSLAGDQLAIHAVRPEVGTRSGAAGAHILPMAEQSIDEAILLAADAALKRAGSAPVLMMTQDRELYKAANGMFEQAHANADNRAYLQGLLRERKVSHLVLVTRARDNRPLLLARGASVANGVLEGVGFYIDDTTQLIDSKTAEAYFGMVVPFAYLKLRLIDVATMAVLGERTATFSYPVVRPSTQPSGMDTWGGMSKNDKLLNIRQAVNGAVDGSLPALLK